MRNTTHYNMDFKLLFKSNTLYWHNRNIHCIQKMKKKIES